MISTLKHDHAHVPSDSKSKLLTSDTGTYVHSLISLTTLIFHLAVLQTQPIICHAARRHYPGLLLILPNMLLRKSPRIHHDLVYHI